MRLPSRAVLEALAVTAELTGTQLSEAAAKVFAQDLVPYPEQQVLGALLRCRREVKGRLVPADVIGRLDDGRPTPDEAWAMIPRDEAATVVWTDEMAHAWGIASQSEDRQASRLAFLSAYRRLVQAARDVGAPPKWTPSLGHDPRGRAQALEDAVRLGRIGEDQADALLSHQPLAKAILQAAAGTLARLSSHAESKGIA